MKLSRSNVVRLTALAFGVLAFPAQALAVCEFEVSSWKMESVTRGTSMPSVFGSISAGVAQLGSAPPIEVQLRNCSTTLTTNVRVTTANILIDGNTYRPYLFAVNGVTLSVPVNLSAAAGYDFVGNPRLSIGLVPATNFSAANAGNFSTSIAFRFVD